MKKMISVIMVLLIIFVGLFLYKNEFIKLNNISVQEIDQIETYITKIYMWKEITKDALPYFENINEVDELWLWEVVKKNLEDYELSYEQIQEKASELFGNGLKKIFPKDGMEFLIYNQETNKYYAMGMGLDEEEDCFFIDKIEKIDNGYKVEIVEYLEDYSKVKEGESGGAKLIVRNLKNEEIKELNDNEDITVTDIVKNNIDKFTKKTIFLKKTNEHIYIERVEE